MDEAHCLSKWGHDFRPDYRYVARYIAENHVEDSAPILCLTATAKHDVVDDIREHFERTLESRLKVVDGGTERPNLEFVAMPTSASQRIEHIHRALENALEREGSGGAIVYCTTKLSTEETAQAFADRGLIAQHFHFGLSPERKREIQRGFHDGDIDVVVATSAFGMGIDKHRGSASAHGALHKAPVGTRTWGSIHKAGTSPLPARSFDMAAEREDLPKHLEFIQVVIERHARTSFVLKGWSVTVVAAVFLLAVRGADSALPMAAGQAVDLHVLHDPASTPQRRIHAAPAIAGSIPSTTYCPLAMGIVQVPSETRCASPLTPESVSRSRPTPYARPTDRSRPPARPC